MDNETPNDEIDLLGIKPVSQAVRRLTDAGVDGVSALLGRICLPAAEEFGLLLRDKVNAWRVGNLSRVAEKAEEHLKRMDDVTSLKASPRIAFSILNEAATIEDDTLQSMWAGLLASACTADGNDDSNFIFVDLLKKLSKLQASLLEYACKSSDKAGAIGGPIFAGPTFLTTNEFEENFGQFERPRVFLEVLQLRAIGLLTEAIPSSQPIETHGGVGIDLTPTSLALHLYVRCQGSRKHPFSYYDVPVYDHVKDIPEQFSNTRLESPTSDK